MIKNVSTGPVEYKSEECEQVRVRIEVIVQTD